MPHCGSTPRRTKPLGAERIFPEPHRLAPGAGAPDREARRPPPRAGSSERRAAAPPIDQLEAEVAEGLEAIARDELRARLGDRARLYPPAPRAVRFGYDDDPRALSRLRTVLAVYLVRRFAVPRPRALLGDRHFRAILAQIATVRGLLPPDAYRTLYLSAAGSDSAVLTRLKDELARHTGLAVASHEGDLLLRLRRAPGGGAAWESLVRLSPRPLGTRPWRVCDLEGALNATVAHAMAHLTRPDPRDVFLNLACGSGTLLIERLAYARAGRAIGCDTGAAALDCARANLAASDYAAEGELHPWDARALPLPDRSVDALCADLPFGHLVGSHAENVALYPAILREAARVARPGARFALITHEVRLIEALLEHSDEWALEETLRVTLGGLHPRIFVLRRG